MTAIVFFFVPISLAGTIFGMNVQQINATGPGIEAFVVTAVVMIVAAMVLWGLFALVADYRLEVKREFMQSPRVNVWESLLWRERLLFVGWSWVRLRNCRPFSRFFGDKEVQFQKIMMRYAAKQART